MRGYFPPTPQQECMQETELNRTEQLRHSNTSNFNIAMQLWKTGKTICGVQLCFTYMGFESAKEQ